MRSVQSLFYGRRVLIDTAPPGVLSNKPAQCEIDQMNGS